MAGATFAPASPTKAPMPASPPNAPTPDEAPGPMLAASERLAEASFIDGQRWPFFGCPHLEHRYPESLPPGVVGRAGPGFAGIVWGGPCTTTICIAGGEMSAVVTSARGSTTPVRASGIGSSSGSSACRSSRNLRARSMRCQRLRTALSVRPGSSSAIVDHLNPCLPTPCSMIVSSRRRQPWLLASLAVFSLGGSVQVWFFLGCPQREHL
mmetsp:Transcript_22876/g.53078  ORF Transcript_22876/g.53078 Transcript_22876/m.53078 type:complete len:210 (-) Transcript_22876:376-1005(-)